MKIARSGALVAIALAGALALSSCAANETTPPLGSSASPLTGTLNGIGSSAQANAQTAWAAGFQTANSAVTVNYDSQGSGAGRKAFIAGSADFAGSDAALSSDELAGKFVGCAADSKAIDLPIYISPIGVVYNVPGVTDLKLDAPTIAGIFKGTITKWDDPAIAAQNAGTTLPSATIVVVHRSDDSGTTENFTDYLATVAPDAWGVPTSQTWPFKVGDAAKGNQGVVSAVTSAQNSIGYADQSAAGSLSIAQLKVGGTYEAITTEGAAAVVGASPLATGRPANDLAITIDRKSAVAGGWPIALVSYMIVCQTYADAARATLVKAYATYVASAEGQAAGAAQAKSAPISSELAAKVVASIATIK
ncbi:MAG TPA: phosphate ABC transporter substrate-binding protein PstS [Terrimesophilobacter sp.]|nr:phosphate ABC transporter substrate-binding protein PstS [Terrimesophilobacter sp.]